jgi:hypothetical protein
MSDNRTFDVPTALTAALSADGARPTDCHERALDDLIAAEELLDWLERKGFTDCQLVVVGTGFVVRWR